jgi:adenine/guanine phosphoribosyltransferase-like PRPP-binding protein
MPEIRPYDVRWHPAAAAPRAGGPYATHYPVPLSDGSTLELPLRALPGGQGAIALLMSNQTPFAVEDALAPLIAQAAAAFSPDCIAAVPTMGLDYARLAARHLGLPHYVALGLSRKFWYDERLSEPVTSSTSPGQSKALYLDPALLARIQGRRVVLVDDVINTGASAAAAIRLLERAGAQVVGLTVALTEGHAWREALATLGPHWPVRVRSAGHIPLFAPAGDGAWEPVAGTL